MHRSPQEQIEPHQLLGCCLHHWLGAATSKSKLESKGGVRRNMFSPQHVTKSLGLSSAPLSPHRKPSGLDRTCNNNHIQPWKKAEGEAMDKQGCICHPSILFNPLLTPPLPVAVVPLAASCAQRGKKSCSGFSKEAAGSQSSGGEGGHACGARHQRALVEGSRAEPNLGFFQGNF